MTPSFTAAYMHSEDMGDHLLVGRADRPHDTVDYLSFQRANYFDEQDIQLGMDAVYVERNDQGYSGYGGMHSVTLFPDRLEIIFDAKGIRRMGGVSSMSVAFAFAPELVETLRTGLQRCFFGFDYFHDETHHA